jgi:hypothetical protein
MNHRSLRQIAAATVPVRNADLFFEPGMRVLAPLSEFRPPDESLALALYDATSDN